MKSEMKLLRLIKPKVGVLLLCGLLPLLICENVLAQVPSSGVKVKTQAPSDAHQKVLGFEAQRDAYLNDARDEMNELKNKIDALKMKAKKSGAATKARLEASVEDFQRDLRRLEKTWADLKNSSASKWDELKTDLDTSIKKLRAEIEGASNP
ncbi:hypothetical protein ACVBEF_00185 [Glaciimonas sp. GG7]